MTTRSTHARHRAPAQRARRIGGMLASTAAVAGASIIAVCAAGGTYALWSGQKPIASATIQTGTMGLTVDGGASAVVDGTAWSNLLPGDVVLQEVTLQNTGNVPDTVSASTTGAFGPLLVHLRKGACAAIIVGTSSTDSPTDLGVFAVGESTLVCIQVTMPATAPANVQSTNQSFTVTFTSTAGS